MRKALMGACVVSMVSLSMAQHLEIGVDGGYGLGVGTALVGKNQETVTLPPPATGDADTRYEDVFASGGKGIKLTGEITYFFNDNIGIMASSGYSTGGGYTTEIKMPSDTYTCTAATSYLPVNIGVKFKAKFGIIEPYLYLAPGVYFPKKTSDSTEIHVSPYTGVTRDDIKITYTYAMGWGISAGFGAMLRVSEKVGIKLEIAPTYAFAKRTKFETEIAGIKHTYIYDETAPLPGNTADTDYLRGTPIDSYCSASVKAGVCFRVF